MQKFEGMNAALESPIAAAHAGPDGLSTARDSMRNDFHSRMLDDLDIKLDQL